ncbi:MAG: GNAT family N-acetyltransferase [Spirochaetales bacterium]|nr:GNAT family N-acetyltransferase [Spirochaetales bacterium]
MDIRQIHWKDTIVLRHRVLWPEKPAEFCHVDGDEQGIHFGAFVDEALVCVASVFVDGSSARLRKFATEESLQGRGIGTRVLNEVIAYLKERDIEYFWCDARESAMGYYRRFGMEPRGERFYKAEVPYFRMGRTLSSPV